MSAIAFAGSIVLAGSAAFALDPHMGGSMKHIRISVVGQSIQYTIDGDPNERLELLNYGEAYDAPADVLDDSAYNSRYGWTADGVINIPPDASIFIQMLNQTPGLESYEKMTFKPIFGMDGSSDIWAWDGTMSHNWMAARTLGDFDATYRIYVGDTATQQPLAGWQSADVTLSWQSTPCMTLSVNNLVAGQNAQFDLSGTGMVDGEKVVIVYGTQLGETIVDQVGGYTADFGLKGVNRQKVVAQGVIAGGVFSASKGIPMAAQGMMLHFQAARQHTYPVHCMSNIVSAVVQ